MSLTTNVKKAARTIGKSGDRRGTGSWTRLTI